MPKPLDQIPPFVVGSPGLSVTSLNALRASAQMHASNFTVAAPLEKRQGAEGIHLRVNEERILPPLPDFDAVLAYDSDTNTVYWLATTEDCPTVTTTTAAPTTTTV